MTKFLAKGRYNHDICIYLFFSVRLNKMSLYNFILFNPFAGRAQISSEYYYFGPLLMIVNNYTYRYS